MAVQRVENFLSALEIKFKENDLSSSKNKFFEGIKPIQTVLPKFSCKDRRFVAKWYNKFSWLEYSEKKTLRFVFIVNFFQIICLILKKRSL